MDTATPTEVQQLCTFYVGPLFMGIDVRVVQEVIRYQEMTAVPLARSGIRGLINLRGSIVTAIDLRTQIGLEPAEKGELPMNVVVRAGESMASLLVDSISDVVDIDPDFLEPPPVTLPANSLKFIRSVYKMEDKLLLLLDPEQAIHVDDKGSHDNTDDSTGKKN